MSEDKLIVENMANIQFGYRYIKFGPKIRGRLDPVLFYRQIMTILHY